MTIPRAPKYELLAGKWPRRKIASRSGTSRERGSEWKGHASVDQGERTGTRRTETKIDSRETVTFIVACDEMGIVQVRG